MLVALVLLITTAWVYLIYLNFDMGQSDQGPMTAMTQPQPWSISDWLFMFLMWAIMMVGMMSPSAAPTILLYTGLLRRRSKPTTRFAERPSTLAIVFLSGYLLVWTGFSVGATSLHWLLDQLSLLSPMMVSANSKLSGLILVVAGIYQWLPPKDACLKHCRSPIDFISQHWRIGQSGALWMGVQHGIYCLGCCWVLMLLLFVGGVMNLIWIALITVMVLVEKFFPQGDKISKGSGIVLATIGFLLVVT